MLCGALLRAPLGRWIFAESCVFSCEFKLIHVFSLLDCVSVTKEVEPESPTNQEGEGAPERVTGSVNQAEPEPRKGSRVRRASVRFGGHEWA